MHVYTQTTRGWPFAHNLLWPFGAARGTNFEVAIFPPPRRVGFGSCVSVFAWLYLVVGIASFVSSSIVIVELELLFGVTPDEETVLLELTPTRSLEPPNHRQRFVLFVKDPSAWILLVSLILNIGPMESYQNNLSSILKHTNGADLPNQVSIMAASSTGARLLLGVLSDYLSKYVCRVWLLVVVIVGVAGQMSETSAPQWRVLRGMFTIYPTIVASIWALTLWGLRGGHLWLRQHQVGHFSMFYGRNADSCSDCLLHYFYTTAGAMIVSCIFVLLAWKIWYARGFTRF